MKGINGKTKVCGIFGDPVEHSFSPAMHNAVFSHLKMDWVYVPFPVQSGHVSEAVRAIKALSLTGVNVTVPHKKAVVDFMDHLSRVAHLSGAVNTIVNAGGVLTGHNTDGEGFIRALEEEGLQWAAKGTTLILGAGGAARAVTLALALDGAKEIVVANRSPDRAAQLCELIHKGTGCTSSVMDWKELPVKGSMEYQNWTAVLERASLVIQTTPMGMHPQETAVPPFPFELLTHKHVVVDLVYNPVRTVFLQRCHDSGARVLNGLGMLLHQGAMAFELWTGKKPPLDVMRRALQKKLYEPQRTQRLK